MIFFREVFTSVGMIDRVGGGKQIAGIADQHIILNRSTSTTTQRNHFRGLTKMVTHQFSNPIILHLVFERQGQHR